MEIDAQRVIGKLTRKLADLETSNVVMEVQIETLQEEIANLSAQIPTDAPGEKSNPVEGEVIG